MYSLEQRTDAIQLFIESGFNENAVIRSLGYPSPTMTIDCLDRTPSAAIASAWIISDPVMYGQN